MNVFNKVALQYRQAWTIFDRTEIYATKYRTNTFLLINTLFIVMKPFWYKKIIRAYFWEIDEQILPKPSFIIWLLKEPPVRQNRIAKIKRIVPEVDVSSR